MRRSQFNSVVNLYLRSYSALDAAMYSLVEFKLVEGAARVFYAAALLK